MKFLVPLAAMAALGVYVEAGGHENGVLVLVGAVMLYMVGALVLLRD